MHALGTFLASPALSTYFPSGLSLDPEAVFVSGLSAGGYIARQYAIHASPKPKAFISLYGMGGDLLGDHYIMGHPAVIPFFGNKVESTEVEAFVGHGSSPQPSSSSGLLPAPSTAVCDDGRHTLFPWAVQQGTLVDYMTGKSGLSAKMKSLPSSDARKALLDESDRELFPQLRAKELPPTFLIHGDADTAVSVKESEVTFEALKSAAIRTELVVVPEAEHALLSLKDRTKEAEGTDAAFAQAIAFLESCIPQARSQL
jgi:acetyl esterase/lipase